jgi:hypothetical protein
LIYTGPENDRAASWSNTQWGCCCSNPMQKITDYNKIKQPLEQATEMPLCMYNNKWKIPCTTVRRELVVCGTWTLLSSINISLAFSHSALTCTRWPVRRQAEYPIAGMVEPLHVFSICLCVHQIFMPFGPQPRCTWMKSYGDTDHLFLTITDPLFRWRETHLTLKMPFLRLN